MVLRLPEQGSICLFQSCQATVFSLGIRSVPSSPDSPWHVRMSQRVRSRMMLITVFRSKADLPMVGSRCHGKGQFFANCEVSPSLMALSDFDGTMGRFGFAETHDGGITLTHSPNGARKVHERCSEWCNGAATMQVDDRYGIVEAIRE
jgi:hypothetical protein